MSFFSIIGLERAIPLDRHVAEQNPERLSPRQALLIWVTASMALWAVLLAAAFGIAKLFG